MEEHVQSSVSLKATIGMIDNGAKIATKGGDPAWPTCLACGIMRKGGGSLPPACRKCLATYCYN